MGHIYTDTLEKADSATAETLEAKIIARRICRFCEVVFKIPVEIIGTVEEIASGTGDAIDTELDDRGWLADACPDCAIQHRQTLADEHQADDDAEEWEGGEYV